MLKERKIALSLLLLITITDLYLPNSLWIIEVNAIQYLNQIDTNKNDREIYGLAGPVRTIRTTTTKMIQKGEDLIKGKEILVETATFDNEGRKIDGSYYPVPGASLTGKEAYKYDENGNLVEATLLKADGSIARKEIYAYDFDSYGNWTKMITSAASNKRGEWTIEISEITYRAIEYYKELPDKDRVVARNPSVPVIKSETISNIAGSVPTKVEPINVAKEEAAKPDTSTVRKEEVRANISGNDGESNLTGSANAAVDGNIRDKSGNSKVKSPVKPKPLAKPISGGILNGNAIELPKPSYPEIALRKRTVGTVTVEVVIDERGMVISAQAISGPSVFYQASVKAAYQAKFHPSLLDGRPVKTVGTIFYNFGRTE